MRRRVFTGCALLIGWLLVQLYIASPLYAAPPAQHGVTLGLRGVVGFDLRMVAAHGSTVLVVSDDQVRFFDLSDPTQPSEISRLTVAAVTDAYLTGEVAYLLTPNGLGVLDVANPAAPFAVDYCAECGGIDLFVAGQRGYVLGDRLHTLDLSDPRQPRLIGSSHVLRAGQAVAGDEQVGYIQYDYYDGCGECGITFYNYLEIFEAADPTKSVVRESPGFSSASGMDLQNGYLYVAGSTSTLGRAMLVLSLADPHAPELVGSLPVAGASDIKVVGAYAYVLTGESLQVIDVADPRQPVLAGTLASPVGKLAHFALVSGRAYLVGSGGLAVLDVSNPSQPVEIGRLGSVFVPDDLAVLQQVAFVVNNQASLDAYDLSNPANPRLLRSVTAVAPPAHLLIHDQRGYLADAARGLVVFDLANPAEPVEVGAAPAIRFRLEDVARATDDHIYAYGVVTETQHTLQIVDVTQPTAIHTTKVVTEDAFSTIFAIAPNGQQVYLLTSTGGDSRTLKEIDLTSPPLTRLTGSWSLPDAANHLVVSGDRAYVAGADCHEPLCTGWLRIYDLSAANQLSEVGLITTTAGVSSLAISGTLALINDGNLHLVDLAQADKPVSLGQFDCGGQAWSMAVAGASVYLTDCRDRLRIVDIHNPAQPVEAGSFPLSFVVGPIAVADGRAFVTDEVGLVRVLDVSNPATPQELGRYSFESFPDQVASQLAVLGQHLFAQYDGSLIVLDVSDPAAIHEVSREYSSASLLVVQGERLFVDDPGLTVYSLTAEGGLHTEAGYSPGALGQVRVDDHTAYIASGRGLRLLDITDPAAPLDLGFYASPYIGALAVRTVGAQQRYLYTSADRISVQNSGNYLQVLNISDLTQPGKSIYQGARQTVSMVIRGDLLFSLLESGTIMVFDLSNPANPVRQGEYWLPGNHGVALDVSGEFVYASNGERLYVLQMLPYQTLAPLVVR